MSSTTYIYVEPPDLFAEIFKTGVDLALAAIELKNRLVAQGDRQTLPRCARSYIEALNSGLEEIRSIKEGLLAAEIGASETEKSSESIVLDAGLGSLEVGGTSFVPQNMASANKDDWEQVEFDAGPVLDLSNVFAVDDAKGMLLDGTEDVLVYLGQERKRLTSLVTLTAAESRELHTLIERIDALAEGAEELGRDAAERAIGPQVDRLVDRLSAGGGQRKIVLGDYLALCNLLGEDVQELDYPALKAARDELLARYMRKKFEAQTEILMEEALQAVGLASAGTTMVSGGKGLLIVDAADEECGLLMRKSEDGALVFTTVSAADPLSVGRERRAAIADEAACLCEKKRRLREELIKRGLSADSIESEEVVMKEIEANRDLCSYMDRRKGRRRSAAAPSASQDLLGRLEVDS